MITVLIAVIIILSMMIWPVKAPITDGRKIKVPWVPTREELIPHIIRLANVKKGDVFYDLGCGDGRVAVAAALKGAFSVCVEIDNDLLRKAKALASKLGVQKRVKFVHADIFDVTLSDATVVYAYLILQVNSALKPKLESELKSGTKVVTNDFIIPGWHPVHIFRLVCGLKDQLLYLYIKGMH